MCLNNILSFVLILSILESFLYQNHALPCQTLVSVCERASLREHYCRIVPEQESNQHFITLLMYCVVQTL